MSSKGSKHPEFRVVPATERRWPDLERLFGVRGACAGCWCMFPRQTASEFASNKGASNRRKLRRLVRAGERPPGLLGYVGDEPVAWCSIEPRESFPRLARSRSLAPVDDRPVWSIVCFFIARDWRGRGLQRRMIRAAVDHARASGARIVEAYPVDPRGKRYAPAFAWHGLTTPFLRSGFREVARRSATRPILRKSIRPRRR